MGREASGSSGQAIVVAFLANVSIAVTKFLGFAVTGAVSLLAEAIHSLADTADQLLLLLGRHRGRHEPTKSHPLGYGRERYVWAFVVAIVLFTGGGLFALLQAEEKLRHPHELRSVAVAIAILVVSAGFEALSLRTAIRRARSAKGDESWYSFIRVTKQAELPVVLLEDSAALIGLGFALVAVVLTAVTGEARFDALGSLGIGILLVAVALTLASEMKSLLVGEAAADEDVAKVRRTLLADARLERIIDLRTEQLGPEEVLVVAEVAIRPGIDSAELPAVLDDLRRAVRSEVPQACHVYLEPG
jgi:cation diffusion facilitator family transporter